MQWIFDHTVCNNLDIIEGERYAKPFPHAKEALTEMKDKGWTIVIHSCNRVAWVKEWLEHWEIPYDSIWDKQGKPVAEAYVDDRAIQFKGNWHETRKEVERFLGSYQT